MRLTLTTLFFLTALGCSQEVTKDKDKLVSNLEASSSIFSAMGEVLISAGKKADPACTVTKQNNTCDLSTSNCKRSEFLLTISGPSCPVNLNFRNEILAVTGGARGTFSWTLTSANPADMPGFIKSIAITGTQNYRNVRKGDRDEILGQVRLDGKVNTEESATEKNEFTFSIVGKYKISTGGQNILGRSEIELILSGFDVIENIKTPFRTSLKEVAGFNSNRKTQSLIYLLDNRAINIAQFKLYSDLGITFFFKSTPASESRPWLGYVGPFNDFFQVPTGL